MKKIYILTGVTYYEGSRTFGAFSSREKAQKVFDDYQNLTKNDFEKWHFDDCEILEVEIDSPVDFN